MIDVIIVSIVALIIGVSVYFMIKNKKNGKCCCSDCSKCSSCPSCKTTPDETEK